MAIAKTRIPKEQSAYAAAKRVMKAPGKKAARALRIGDVLELYYEGVTEPIIEVVVHGINNEDDIFDVQTVPLKSFQNGDKQTMSRVHTDMWKKIGTMQVTFVPSN